MYVCTCKYVHICTYPDGPDVRFVAAFPVSSIVAMSPQDQSLFAECHGLQLRSPVAVGRQAGDVGVIRWKWSNIGVEPSTSQETKD